MSNTVLGVGIRTEIRPPLAGSWPDGGDQHIRSNYSPEEL